MLDTLDPPRPDTTEAPRARRRTTRVIALTVTLVGLTLVGLTIAAVPTLMAHEDPIVIAHASPQASPNEPPIGGITLPAAEGATDPETRRTLQDATGLAASLLVSTRSTEVARSALVAAQDMTGCAPREGGPAQVHVGNRAERTAELAARADFYATARENGREYATHARAYLDKQTIVFVAVAWECGPGT
jgi:hypothetical protein